MKFIIVPFSELVSLLEDTLDLWPLGYNLPEDERERSNVITEAAGTFCKNLILQSVAYIRNKPDPLLELLKGLGYPIDIMNNVELDDLIHAVDDRYLELTTTFDAIEEVVTAHLEGKHFEMIVKDEDVLIEIGNSLIVERYREMTRRVKELTPPKITNVDQLDSLDPMIRYIDRMVAETFKDIPDEATRVEMKRVFDLTLKRQ